MVLAERLVADVAIVGSGPAGVAVAERLRMTHPHISVVVVERGELLLREHFYDSGTTIRERDSFLERHLECPWTGDMSAGGRLLPVLGGRGVVGGAQLHRFYSADLNCWANGTWPLRGPELGDYFDLAEERILGVARSDGTSQREALQRFDDSGASHPPFAGSAATKDVAANAGHPHRSSIERLLELYDRGIDGSFRVATSTRALRFEWSRSTADTAVTLNCIAQRRDLLLDLQVEAKAFVLAASPIESTRIALASSDAARYPAAMGRYLAEHMYVRGMLDVSADPELFGPISLHIAPQGDDERHRYQLDLRSMGTDPSGRHIVRITGSAAMDPNPENRVFLDPIQLDDLGSPLAVTRLTQTTRDRQRLEAMRHAIRVAAERLGGTWATGLQVLPPGASYHEGGCMRIGRPGIDECAADIDGRLIGTSNVFVGDAAAFPAIGVANPILTLTAMGYRLADHLSASLPR